MNIAIEKNLQQFKTKKETNTNYLYQFLFY